MITNLLWSSVLQVAAHDPAFHPWSFECKVISPASLLALLTQRDTSVTDDVKYEGGFVVS